MEEAHFASGGKWKELLQRVRSIPRLGRPIDPLLIDAGKEGCVDYVEKLAPKPRPGRLIVVLNSMQPLAPDSRYASEITAHPSLQTLFLIMHVTGVGLTRHKICEG